MGGGRRRPVKASNPCLGPALSWLSRRPWVGAPSPVAAHHGLMLRRCWPKTWSPTVAQTSSFHIGNPLAREPIHPEAPPRLPDASAVRLATPFEVKNSFDRSASRERRKGGTAMSCNQVAWTAWTASCRNEAHRAVWRMPAPMMLGSIPFIWAPAPGLGWAADLRLLHQHGGCCSDCSRRASNARGTCLQLVSKTLLQSSYSSPSGLSSANLFQSPPGPVETLRVTAMPTCSGCAVRHSARPVRRRLHPLCCACISPFTSSTLSRTNKMAWDAETPVGTGTSPHW